MTTIAVSPASATLRENGTLGFSAVACDHDGVAMSPQPGFSWTRTAGMGAIDAGSGLYTAPGYAGVATVQATPGAVSGTATVTVVNEAPQVAQPASTPAPRFVAIATTCWSTVTSADMSGSVEIELTDDTYRAWGMLKFADLGMLSIADTAHPGFAASLVVRKANREARVRHRRHDRAATHPGRLGRARQPLPARRLHAQRPGEGRPDAAVDGDGRDVGRAGRIAGTGPNRGLIGAPRQSTFRLSSAAPTSSVHAGTPQLVTATIAVAAAPWAGAGARHRKRDPAQRRIAGYTSPGSRRDS